MGVLRDWNCLAHGPFESSEDAPECPMGCDTVEIVFLTPPAFHNGRTANIDKTLNSLAKSHKLTDLGPAAMRRKALASEKAQQQYKEFCQRRFGGFGWGQMPQGGTLNVDTQKIEGSGAGAQGAMSHAGASPTGVLNDLKPILQEVRKPTLIRRDHENLTIADAKAA